MADQPKTVTPPSVQNPTKPPLIDPSAPAKPAEHEHPPPLPPATPKPEHEQDRGD